MSMSSICFRRPATAAPSQGDRIFAARSSRASDTSSRIGETSETATRERPALCRRGVSTRVNRVLALSSTFDIATTTDVRPVLPTLICTASGACPSVNSVLVLTKFSITDMASCVANVIDNCRSLFATMRLATLRACCRRLVAFCALRPRSSPVTVTASTLPSRVQRICSSGTPRLCATWLRTSSISSVPKVLPKSV